MIITITGDLSTKLESKSMETGEGIDKIVNDILVKALDEPDINSSKTMLDELSPIVDLIDRDEETDAVELKRKSQVRFV